MSDLLPPSATKQEQDIALSIARISTVPSQLRPLWNPETCSLETLPWLAWALSVDTWNPAWPEHTKRAVVKSAISTSRRKGTAAAVTEALDALGVSSVINEWFQQSPIGTAHTFKVLISSADISVDAQTLMKNEINRTKPLRSHYTMEFAISTNLNVGVVSIMRPTVFVRLDSQTTY